MPHGDREIFAGKGSPVLLTHANLRIRGAMLEDAPLLCRWWNDGRVMAHAGFPHGLYTNPEEIREALRADADDTCRRLILEVDGIPVGEMSYRNKGKKTAEIGIKICEVSQQGKGYGTLFLMMLISGLFQGGYEKIVLDTNLNNVRAQHVYEKLGFQRVRVNRDAWMNQLGEPQSSVDYALEKAGFVPLGG